MANKIVLHNIYSFLKSKDERLLDALDKGLSFYRKGYFMSPAYKQKRWDGKDRYFQRNTGRFLTGLLPEVVQAMDRMGCDVEFEDQRDPYNFAVKSIDEDFLGRVKLYDYQVEYVNQIIKHKRGLVQAPTSAGKSLCIVAAIKCLPARTPTLVLVGGLSLTKQIYNDLEEWDVADRGLVLGGKKPVMSPGIVTVANLGSLHKIERLLPYFRALFVDEVHSMMSKVPKDYYKRMPLASVRVGFSATPFKYGGSDKSQVYEVKGFFGPVLRKGGLKTKELQGRGILSKSNCIFHKIHEPDLKYEIYQDAVVHGISECVSFNQKVADLAVSLSGRTLIIVERIPHGEMLHAMIPGSRWIYGKDGVDARQEVIKMLQSEKEGIAIVQQRLISEGVNTRVHNLILAMGGLSDHGVIQRIGRGLRTAIDKDGMIYHDFLFLNNQYLEKHSRHRIKVLEREGHDIEIREDL